MNPTETSEMMAFIEHVRSSRGVTILLIEHQMRMVMAMSDTVTVLDHGVKIAEGRPAESTGGPRGDRGLSRRLRQARRRYGAAGAASRGRCLMALLEIDDIRVFYDKIEALKGISLTVHEKQIVTLVGVRTGRAKSTTLRGH